MISVMTKPTAGSVSEAGWWLGGQVARFLDWLVEKLVGRRITFGEVCEWLKRYKADD